MWNAKIEKSDTVFWDVNSYDIVKINNLTILSTYTQSELDDLWLTLDDYKLRKLVRWGVIKKKVIL